MIKKFLAAVLVAMPVCASANVTYTAITAPYQTVSGSYTTSMGIKFQFVTPSALPINLAYGPYAGTILSWQAFDGIATLTNTSPGVALSMYLSTNPFGAINQYSINAYTGTINMLFSFDGTVSTSSPSGTGYALGSATWTSSSAVPEPASAFLFIGGLAAWGARRKFAAA